MATAAMSLYLQKMAYRYHQNTTRCEATAGLSWIAARYIPALHLAPAAAVRCTAAFLFTNQSLATTQTTKLGLAMLSSLYMLDSYATVRTQVAAATLPIACTYVITYLDQARSKTTQPVSLDPHTTAITALGTLYANLPFIALAAGTSHVANQYLLPLISQGSLWQSNHAAPLALLATAVYYITSPFCTEIETAARSPTLFQRVEFICNRALTCAFLIKQGVDFLGMRVTLQQSALALGISLIPAVIDYWSTKCVKESKTTSETMLDSVFYRAPLLVFKAAASYGLAYAARAYTPTFSSLPPLQAAHLTLLASATFFLTLPLFKEVEIEKQMNLSRRVVHRVAACSLLVWQGARALQLTPPTWKHAVLPLGISALQIAASHWQGSRVVGQA